MNKHDINYFSSFVEEGAVDLKAEVEEFIINSYTKSSLDMKSLISFLIKENILPKLPVDLDDYDLDRENATVAFVELYLYF